MQTEVYIVFKVSKEIVYFQDAVFVVGNIAVRTADEVPAGAAAFYRLRSCGPDSVDSNRSNFFR